MKPIGGFFELEVAKSNSIYHENAIMLSTGRACLNYILKYLKPDKVYLPFYCCDALFEPIEINSIDYEFYSINESLEIDNLPLLKQNEIIIYINYFGIKTDYINTLLKTYNDKVIIDNTHSFFTKNHNTDNYSFTSARKYFGVPDGAFLYSTANTTLKIDIKRNQKISIDHNLHRLIGLQEKAYAEYVIYEKNLGSDIEKISLFSEKILSTIDYQEVRKIRNDNFNYYTEEFKNLNRLHIDENVKDCFCYPLFLEKPIEKEKLYKEKIFIPNLWLDTLNRKHSKDYELECKLSTELLPLPLDHRYSKMDLKRVVSTIKKILYE